MLEALWEACGRRDLQKSFGVVSVDLHPVGFSAVAVQMVREKVFRQDRLAVDIPDRIAEDMVITFRKSFRISNDQDLVDAGGKDEKIFPKRIREVF